MKKVLSLLLVMTVVSSYANYYSRPGQLTQTNVYRNDQPHSFTITLQPLPSDLFSRDLRYRGGNANAQAGIKTYQQAQSARSQKTIAQIVASKPEFSTLRKALETAGLFETLNGGTEFTVFAPTNAAFSKLKKEVVDELFAKPEKLKSILLYHVVPNKYLAKDVAQLKAAQTVEGEDVKFVVYNGSVKVNSANVSQADVDAKNGVIHVIDAVLVPQE
jgi:uncharacterized surface protein with fasciclin (FAS1) repeats